MRLLANDKMRIITTAKCNLDCFYCHNEGQEKVTLSSKWIHSSPWPESYMIARLT